MFGTRRALLGGNALDPDALAYFARAGVSDSAVTPTAYDNAASFNGSSQYLSIASNSTLQGGGSMSVCAWVKMTSPSTTPQVFVGKDGIASREYILAYSLSGSSRNVFSFAASPPNTEVYATSFGAANAGQWYFVVGTYDGTNQKIYVNSIASGSSAVSAPIAGAAPFTIGERNYTGFNNFVNGSISGVGFWSRALSSTEITTLYNGGIGLTYSGIVSAGLTTNLNSYWALNETTSASSYADSKGSNNLTPTATPTNSTSPIATSIAPSRQLINSFVKGVKGLGLWSSMVCWPLRSSQNSQATTGTGSILSLGGFGSYNATPTSNPSWQSQGLVFSNALANYLNCGTVAALGSQFSIFDIATIGNAAVARAGVFTFGNTNSTANSSAHELPFAPTTNEAVYSGFSTSLTVANNTSTHMTMGGLYSSATSGQFTTAGQIGLGTYAQNTYSSASWAGTSNTFTIGRNPTTASSFSGLIPAVMVFANTQPTAALYTQIYNIYMTTLGIGLL